MKQQGWAAALIIVILISSGAALGANGRAHLTGDENELVVGDNGQPLLQTEENESQTNGTSSSDYVLVYITQKGATTESLKKFEIEKRFSFGESFSAKVPKSVYQELKSKERVAVEKVKYYGVVDGFKTGKARERKNRESMRDRFGNIQRNLASPSDQTPYGIETIYNDASIDSTSGGSGVDVAVLDTGVYKGHPDLKNRVEICKNATGGSIVNGECEDKNGHGTHVAGTVLADGGNGNGIYGVAPEADLYAYKVCSPSCPSDAIATAIRDATDEGAEIISLSLGGPTESVRIHDAIKYARSKGVLVVAASGNDGPDIGTILYPAGYSEVISVGATDKGTGDIEPSNYAVTDFSSRGKDASSFKQKKDYIEVSAPGAGIISTTKDGSYGKKWGTSMATPHISGFAAKVWSSVDDSDGDGEKDDDVRSYIQNRAENFDITKGKHAGDGYDPAAGLGTPVLFASSSGGSNSAPSAKFTYSPDNPKTGEKISFDASDSSDSDGSINKYEWDWDNDGNYESSGKTTSHKFSSSGDHKVTLRVTDDAGSTDKKTKTVSVSESNSSPTAKFSYSPSDPEAGEKIEFDASDSSDSDGSINKYEWDWDNDGNFESTGKTASHKFSNAGDYKVTLLVTDDAGSTDKKTKTVSVNEKNKKPRASFEYSPEYPSSNGSIEFDASTSSDSDGLIKKYRWDFDNDGEFDASGKTASHKYGSSGNYEVTLQVTDNDGDGAKKTKTVEVKGDAEIEYSNLSVSKKTANVSEKIEVTAKVKNTGGKNGSYNATFEIGDEIQKYKTGELGPGESKKLSFTTAFNSTGEYDLAVKNLSAVTVKVRYPPHENLSASIDATPANAGGTAKVEVTVKNTGERPARTSPTARIEGVPQNWSVTEHQDEGARFIQDEVGWSWDRIDPGATKTVSVTFEIPENESGSYEIEAAVIESENLVDSSKTTVEVKDMTVEEAIAGSDGKMEFKDVQKAIQYWVNEETVPGTDKKLSFSELQKIIASWASS